MYKTHTVRSSLHPVWNESYQVKISNSSQQMMTVKIMAEKEGCHDEFIGVVVVPVSRIMLGESWTEKCAAQKIVLHLTHSYSRYIFRFVYCLYRRSFF